MSENPNALNDRWTNETLGWWVPPGAASERAASESAGPVKVVDAVATGSNPASVGLLDMLEWKWRSIAAQHRKSAEQTQSSHESTRFKSAAEALEACALELRLLTGATTERQPESNIQVSHTAGK